MKEHINLFQLDVLERRGAGERSQIRWGPLLFLALVLILVGFYAQDVRKRRALTREVQAMLGQRDQLNQQLTAVTAASLTLNRENKNANAGLESIFKERILWSRVLQEVSLVVPEGVWMTQFETDVVQGVRFEGFATSYQKVTDLISALEASKIFQDVLLDFSRQNQNEKQVDFSIHAHLRKGASLEAARRE